MSLLEQFTNAKERVTKLPEAPDNTVMLQLYGLFKQATEGDVSGKKPGLLDFVKKMKFEAWEANKGRSKDQAMQAYIELVDKLEKEISR